MWDQTNFELWEGGDQLFALSNEMKHGKERNRSFGRRSSRVKRSSRERRLSKERRVSKDRVVQ